MLLTVSIKLLFPWPTLSFILLYFHSPLLCRRTRPPGEGAHDPRVDGREREQCEQRRSVAAGRGAAQQQPADDEDVAATRSQGGVSM